MSEAAAQAPSGGARDPTRERLISAAVAVFSEKGYDRAGVQEIARRAGLTTGAIYGRFSGKAELLLEAIIGSTHTELDELFASHRFDGRVTDILTTVGSHLVTRSPDPSQALLLEALVAARRHPEIADRVRELLEQRATLLAELVTEAKATGSVDPALDTESVVRFCHAVGFGFLVFEAVGVSRPGAEPWQELIARLVAAIAPPSPSTGG